MTHRAFTHRALTLAAALCLPGIAGSHPHVFVDTALTIRVSDAGRVTGVEMVWTYDEFISLLILEDMGLDADGDGVLTPAENARLLGFDLTDWPEGFEGDLYVEAGGADVDLPRPEPVSARLENGQLVSRQRRAVPDVPVETFLLRQYDPTYYVAYTLESVTVEGAACSVRRDEASPSEAEQALAEALDETGADPFAVVQLGIHYADRIALTCPGS